MKLTLGFGALSPPLKEQLGENFPGVDHLQKDIDAITRLSIRGYLTESQKVQAHKKLIKAIQKASREAA